MKHPILMISLLLSLACLLNVGCKKSDCPDFACENGGTCFNGGCACPEGFTGPDCSEVIYTPLMLTQVKVKRFPALRISGEEWDGGNATKSPDIYIALKYNGDIIYLHQEHYREADYNEEYVFDIPIGEAVLYQPGKSYKISLYDRDTYTDDLIGELSFVPINEVLDNDYPITFSMDEGGRVAFEVTLRE